MDHWLLNAEIVTDYIGGTLSLSGCALTAMYIQCLDHQALTTDSLCNPCTRTDNAVVMQV
jgi:hypothetical protein